MRYRHTMIRVTDLGISLDFWCNQLGLQEIRRKDYPSENFTLVFLAGPADAKQARRRLALYDFETRLKASHEPTKIMLSLRASGDL